MALTKQNYNHLKAHHQSFEEFANLMQKSHQQRFDKIFWAFLESYTQNKTIHQIVDFGTGPALLLIDLAQKYPDTKIIGIDAQPAMLKKASQNIKNAKLFFKPKIELITHDLGTNKKTKIKSNSTDLAICSMVLHELLVPTYLIDEAYRILKKGGIFIVYDWIKQPLEIYFEGKRPETLNQFTHFSEHSRYTPKDFVYLFKKSKFTVLEYITRHNEQHALFAFQK
jgi:ubiquinone/menaquinone biosynthesis C-methylase UbiE